MQSQLCKTKRVSFPYNLPPPVIPCKIESIYFIMLQYKIRTVHTDGMVYRRPVQNRISEESGIKVCQRILCNLHTTHGNCLTLRTLHKQIYIVQHPAGDSVDKIPIHPFHHCRKSSEGHKDRLENTEVRATL